MRAAAVLVPCLVLLGLAIWLRPDSARFGTHKQLGMLLGQHPLPPCTMITFFGYPCPTCGMTTAFAHTVRAQFISAFIAQPAGLFLALLTIATAVGSARVLFTGRPFEFRSRRLSAGWGAVIIVAILLAGWAFKLILGLISGTLPARP